MRTEVKTRQSILKALPLLAVLTAVGCSTTGSGSLQNTAAKTDSVSGANTETVPRPSKPAKVKEDRSSGLTVTESVRISSDIRAEFDRAVALLENDEISAGITALESVVASAPELTSPHIDLGIAYRRDGQMEKAESSLKRALYLTPEHPVAHNELGIVYRKTGRFNQARQSYEKALQIHRDFHYAHLNLGMLCDLFLRDLDCALENYQAYKKAFPDDKKVSIWIADAENRKAVSR